MLFLAHQLGHKVSDSVEAPTTVTGLTQRMAYTRRRKRPYGSFSLFKVGARA
jgi:hypothetical protein